MENTNEKYEAIYDVVWATVEATRLKHRGKHIDWSTLLADCFKNSFKTYDKYK